MTPAEREEWARHFNYREPTSGNDPQGYGLALLAPFILMGYGVATIANGDTLGLVGGCLLIALGIVVMSWAWQYFSRPLRPDNDDDFDRELRYRIEDEARQRRT